MKDVIWIGSTEWRHASQETLLTWWMMWLGLGHSGDEWGFVVKLLTGAFQRAVDEKQRIAIPKRFREKIFPLAESPHGTLYVAPGTDSSLSIYPEEAFEKLAEQLGNASPAGPEVRAFSRLFYARAQAVEMDKQGRIRIPADLAQLAQLHAEAMLVGVRDHLELWDAKLWQEYVRQREGEYDSLAERALGTPQ